MIKVLFVCLGNICRSPMAEAIFNDLIIKHGLEHKILSHSAGTASYHVGQAPDARTITTVSKRGIPIHHKGRQLVSHDLNDFRYIIAMDSSNLKNILLLGGEYKYNVFLMRDFDPINQGGDVPDPYYGGQLGFEDIFHILERSCLKLLKYIEKEAGL